ncbi:MULTISPECIES: hypothetical protein [unclassified Nitrospina]|uniref:hypothetical protein n=1 Tax=unclassified Nitrospina TaxID=2638683 RepID=UPI003F9D13EA
MMGLSLKPKGFNLYLVFFVTAFYLLRPGLLEAKTIPEELAEFARSKGCAPIENYYENKPGMVLPLYLYGYTSIYESDKDQSAVVWCSRDNKNVLLFLYKDEFSELAKCPHEIEWNGPPRGLSYFMDAELTLNEFQFITNPDNTGDKNIKMSHKGISSIYDGVGVQFYCHEGNWLFRLIH